MLYKVVVIFTSVGETPYNDHHFHGAVVTIRRDKQNIFSYSVSLHLFSKHDYDRSLLFPDHQPKISESGCDRTLGQNVVR